MSSTHICKGCGGSVFTLAPSTHYVKGVNTGIKVVTCMTCGSQDEPNHHKVDGKTGEVIGMSHKKSYDADIVTDLEKLRAKWLEKFNTHARNHEDTRRRHDPSFAGRGNIW